MILCKCPSCGKAYKVSDEMAGRSAKCPCGNRFVIKQPGDVTPAPTPEVPAAPQPVAQPQVTQPEPAPVAAPEPVSPPEPVAAPEPITPQAVTPPPAPQPAFQAVRLPTMVSTPAPAAAASSPAIQPAKVPAFAQAAPAAPRTAPAARKPKVDDGPSGIGRGLYTAVLVGAFALELALLFFGKNSGSMVRHALWAGWGLVCIVGMLILTQLRLMNIGLSELLAFIWPAVVGWCAVFPQAPAETDKAPAADAAAETPAPAKAGSSMLVVAAIAFTVVFYAVVGGIGYWIWFRA